MFYEVYYNEEVKDQIANPEDLDRWNRMIDELGLDGQKKLTADDTKSPVSFHILNRNQINALEVLYEREVEVSLFDRMPIPEAVLSAIALAVDEKYFDSIVIRFDDDDPDPVVLGKTGYFYEANYYSDSNKKLEGKRFTSYKEIEGAGAKHINFMVDKIYLIARFAEIELMPFSEICKAASQKFKMKRTISLQSQIREHQREIEDLDSTCMKKFGVIA